MISLMPASRRVRGSAGALTRGLVGGVALLVGLAMCTAAWIGVAAPAQASASPAAVSNASVFGLGDSLFWQCGDSLGVGPRSSGMVGWWGGTTADMRKRLSSSGGDWPYQTEPSHGAELSDFRSAGTLVIGLGTNDARLLTTAQYRTNVDWFMAQAAGRPVLWFNVHFPSRRADQDRINAVLADAAARYANLRILDWDGYATAHPGALAGDGVHLSTYADGCENGRFALIRALLPATTAPLAAVPSADAAAAIAAEYTAVGAVTVLGSPTGEVVCGLKSGGCYQDYASGSIYYNPATGAHAVTDPTILGQWRAQWAEMGVAGYPTGDTVCGLRDGGCTQTFQSGTMFWSPASGAQFSVSVIDSAYAALGRESGPLGYPTTAFECSLAGAVNGCLQGFQNRTIYWSPDTGAHWVHGAIFEAWGATGYEYGPVGFPTGDEQCALAGGGCVQTFVGGAIYWSPASGAHYVHGGIGAMWGILAAERGFLRYPLTGEACGLRGGGCAQVFQGGWIHWSPATGAQPVHGAIANLWSTVGWENGWLGYPVTAETGGLRGGGAVQVFQGGWIYWSPSTGAQPVHGAIRTVWAAQGYENGRLGYPVTGEYPVRGGVAQRFQGGVLTFSFSTGRVR